MRSVCVTLSLLVLNVAATAQQYVISTYAGGAPAPPTAPALSVGIGQVQSVATDAVGNVYFASSFTRSIFRLDPSGVLTRVAGNSRAGFSGDGGPATSAAMGDPSGVAVDGEGNLFIADSTRIRRISPGGIITSVAGNGSRGASGDGGPATGAQLSMPFGVAVDGAGNLFIADPGRHTIRKVSPSGIISTVAGNGTAGFSGDGGAATSAQLNAPVAVAIDAAGNLFIVDRQNSRIRKVSPGGIITTVAGNGGYNSQVPFAGDGGPATSAALLEPFGVAVDGIGNLYVADTFDHRIRKVSAGGIISTVAGGGGSYGEGGPATSADLGYPSSVAVDHAGNLFIAAGERIRKVSADGIITTVAGNGDAQTHFSGDGGAATNAQLSAPSDVAIDAAGNLFIADTLNQRIRKVSASGIITTVAGNGTHGSSGDGGPATGAELYFPAGVAVDGAGNIFATESTRVRKVSPDGIITTVAGNGTQGFSGDGGPATNAQLHDAARVAADRQGNLFIVDLDGPRIRRVSTVGTITTVAGNGQMSFSGDGGPATSAALNPGSRFFQDDGPGGGLALDGAGNLLFADTYNHRIREVSPAGIITTVAGNGMFGSSGDGGPATSANLAEPFDVAADGAGNVFIADPGNGRIRKLSAGGIVTTVAGGGNDFPGDGGPATSAALYFPAGIAADSAGNVYFAETLNNSIRVLRPITQPVWIGAVVDAASQRADPVSPGKIVVIYGFGLGPVQLTQNQASNGQFSKEIEGTAVLFNGIAAPVLYTSGTQVAAIVPYAIGSTTAQVTVTHQGEISAAFTVPVAAAAPNLFTLNQTGAGQAAAVNAVDGTVNSAANPVKIGGYISLYATGEGQTAPGGLDGKLGGSTPTHPVLTVSVTIGGIAAQVQYAGGAPGQIAGLMQINARIPDGVQPGGYVPVVLRVGNGSTTPGAIWIAVSAN